MHRIIPVILLSLVAGCAHAPPPPAKSIELTCRDLVRKLERDSSLSEVEKRRLGEEFVGAGFAWKLRVLTVSEQTSQLDLDRAILMDAECVDRPQSTQLGARYFMSVYFNQKVQGVLQLRRGSVIQLTGEFSSYEGDAAFALQGRAFRL